MDLANINSTSIYSLIEQSPIIVCSYLSFVAHDHTSSCTWYICTYVHTPVHICLEKNVYMTRFLEQQDSYICIRTYTCNISKYACIMYCESTTMYVHTHLYIILYQEFIILV